MIICRRFNIAFVHIPKNGGSTIKQQLRDLDDYDGFFYKTQQLGQPLGRVNANHLNLGVLREHFPKAFRDLCELEAFAVSRDPVDRFVSSMAQWVRGRLKIEPSKLSRVQLEREVVLVVDRLREMGARLEIEYSHFGRQCEFIRLDGEDIVRNVFPIERMRDLAEQLSARTHHSLSLEAVANPTVTYRLSVLEGPLKRLKHLSKRLMPSRLYVRARDQAVALFTTPGAQDFSATIRQCGATKEFISEYYKEDFDIHARSMLQYRTRSASVPPKGGS